MVDTAKLAELIARGETLEIEFKSDRRTFSDKLIYEEIVALANTRGGVLLIGVENDGTVSGSTPRHGTVTDAIKLQSAIFNNTIPSINTRVSIIPHPNGNVIAVDVDSYPEPCATATGKSLRRTIGPDGKPQTVPFYPRDQRSRRTDLGLLDFTSQVFEDLSTDAFDPLEFERMRRDISRLRGDRNLLELPDEELAKALRLVESHRGRLVPTIAGLLLLGRESVLADVIPTHQVHFQVLDAHANVKVNDAFRFPLLRTLQEIESRFAARNEEKEILIGMVRLPIPNYSPDGFREAVNNAILHRDFTRQEDVYIQMHHDHLQITNPGGFPEGVTIDNILVHEPKPRNPRLAEAFKRIGLIEQTGRGVDRIFEGQLRYGRPAPDYSRSDLNGVRVVLDGGEPSLKFAAFVYEEDRPGHPITLDNLIILNALHSERRVDAERAGLLIQKGPIRARRVLENLVERGLIEASGEKKGRVYHLSAALYRRLGQAEGYVRAHGIAPLRHEALVMEFVQAHGRIQREQVMTLCGLTGDQASRLLKKMCVNGKLRRLGTPPRWVYYVAASK